MSDQCGKVLSFGPFELSIGNMLLANGAIVPLGARHGSPHRSGGASKQGRRQENPDQARLAKERSRTSHPFVSSVATTETLEEWYQAYDGNDALDDLGRKSPRRTQFPLTRDPFEPTSPGHVRLAFA